MLLHSARPPLLSLCALLLVSQTALAQAGGAPPYRVTYENGVTVEVIAVSMPPSRHKPFWEPSGAKLIEKPYDARETPAFDAPREGAAKVETTAYEVVVRVTGLKDKPVYMKQRAQDGINVSYPSIPFAKGARQEDLREFQIQVPKGNQMLEFELAIAANDWKLLRSFTTKGSSGAGPDRVDVLEPSDHQKIMKKEMHYYVKLPPSEDALRVVAVDDTGALHISSGSWWMGGQDHSLEVVLPGVAKEKVKEYRIEKTSYQWQTLKGIALRPPGDWDKLVAQYRLDRLMAAEAKFNPEVDAAKIEEAIEKISRTRAFDDSDTWVGAIKELAEIGPPAIPAIVAEIQNSCKPYGRSSLAIALRAIGDPRAVPGLAEGLRSSPFAPNDYGGGTTKDPALLHFMLNVQRGGGYRDERGPTYDLGRPVNEITYSLETLSGHRIGGQHQMRNDRGLYEQAAEQWRAWWEKNKATATAGLPVMLSARKDEWTPLHLAIAQGRRDVAKELVQGGAELSTSGFGGWTALHLAAAMGEMELCRLLLDKKANPAAKTSDGCTALHAAVGLGHAPFFTPRPKPDVKLINLLIERGADPKVVDGRGRTALHGAVAAGDAAAVELLVDVGVDVKAKDARGRTPLHRAVACGNEAAIDVLLAAGADVNANDNEDKTPIRFAFYSIYYLTYNPPLVAKLIERGAEVDLATLISLGKPQQVAEAIRKNPTVVNEAAKTDDKEPPIHWAIRRKSPEMVKILLDAGADPNAKERSGNTPLHMAVFGGDQRMIQMLIAAKADVNAQGQGGCPPLYWACSRLNVELVNQLLAAGAKPTIQNTSGWSPLGSTFSGARDANDRFNPANPQQKMERAIAITKALLARGADPNERMASENYPLVFFAPLELAPLLLEAGAKLDATNDAGDTMLHYAAAISREELIPFLIERGVPLEAKNKKGETALHRAVGFLAPKGETLKLLLDKGADVKAVDNDGRTPLHRAVMQGTPAPVEALLEKGSDIEAKDREGATPLHLAAKGGRDQLVTLLLRRGAAVDAVDAQGKTALDWATKESTRKILIEHGGEGEKK